MPSRRQLAASALAALLLGCRSDRPATPRAPLRARALLRVLGEPRPGRPLDLAPLACWDGRAILGPDRCPAIGDGETVLVFSGAAGRAGAGVIAAARAPARQEPGAGSRWEEPAPALRYEVRLDSVTAGTPADGPLLALVPGDAFDGAFGPIARLAPGQGDPAPLVAAARRALAAAGVRGAATARLRARAELELDGDGRPETALTLGDPRLDPDLRGITADSFTALVLLWGAGGEARVVELTTPSAPRGLGDPRVAAAVDLDGDGRRELVVALRRPGGSGLRIYRGAPAGLEAVARWDVGF